MMDSRKRILSVLLVVVLVCNAVIAPSMAASETDDVLAIDDDHGLADEESISSYKTDGVSRTSLTQVDGSLAMAKHKSDVGADAKLLPTDARNNFIRIKYEEDFQRTLRILIPREYQIPYTQENVQSVTSDHTASFRPARGAEYLEIVVTVDGPADIVLPVQKDSSLSYRGLEWADTRVKAATGQSVFGDKAGDNWQYLDDEELSNGTAYELEGSPEEIAVQYDAEKANPHQTWLNAPKGGDEGVGAYWFVRESGDNQTAYLVVTDDDPPAIRYKSDAHVTDTWLAEARDAAQIPERIKEINPLGGDSP